MGFEWLKPGVVLGSLVYALIGVIIFWLCFLIIDKITPYDLWLSLIHISEPTRLRRSRMPSSA